MEYDFEKLGKEIVTESLQGAKGAPELAGEMARKIIVSAVAGTRDNQEPSVTIAAVCRGVMNGMMLLGLDLPKTAVALIKQMSSVAHETGLAPADCMIWAMEGIAPIAWLAPGGTAEKIRRSIEENFFQDQEVLKKLVHTIGS